MQSSIHLSAALFILTLFVNREKQFSMFKIKASAFPEQIKLNYLIPSTEEPTWAQFQVQGWG